jgi:hypothetical protein
MYAVSNELPFARLSNTVERLKHGPPVRGSLRRSALAFNHFEERTPKRPKPLLQDAVDGVVLETS